MTEAAAAVVLEGQLKWREGKKWKSRWLVLRKPSPVADCLLLLVYKERAERMKGLKERSSLTLEDICGLEPGFCYEGLNHTLAIICLTQVVMLGFENKETMQVWDAQIRYRLGEVHRFQVVVAPGTKLESGPATLHFCNDILVLVKDVPPIILGQWKLSDLRRYGAVPNGFVFEGGTRCGFWAGVFLLSCTEGEKISFLFDCIVHGISPTKGLHQVLADSSTTPACMEERVAYEASQLEKRLSLLSHTGCHSTGGDDRSLSSTSSDTSRSDASSGSRLSLWPELSLARTSQEPHGLAAAKGSAPGEGRLHLDGARGTAKPPPKVLHGRQLQEIGRQSSSDSGIATGSHSSYSGSFSSHAGSLDICPGDEFGSLVSLPPGSLTDQSLCGCLQRSLASDYQKPSSLRHIYDSPRGLFPTSPGAPFKDQTDKGAAKQLEGVAASRQGQEKAPQDAGELESHLGWRIQRQEARSPETSPFRATSSGLCSSPSGATPTLFQACSDCGGIQETSILSSQIFPPTLGPEGSYELPIRRTKPGLRLDLQDVGDPPGSERLPTYVNIPTSPKAKKQLHYMELELQETNTSLRGNESSKYVQIDITATEAAHKVGAQHAQGRELRLQELEQQKKDGQAES